MLVFVTAVSVALVFSFLCSIFESVLLSVRYSRVESLAAAGRPSGRLLRNFKQDIDTPIAAILIVNTIAHTVGASVAGASYSDVFDAETLWIFTIVFTIAVLLFTEIIPKTLGVSYADRLAPPVAFGIYAFTVALKPLVAVAGRISRALRGGAEPMPITSVEEIRLLASLGRQEGSVGLRTASMIVGATRLRQLRAIDVMVPREAVRYLSGDMTREKLVATLTAERYSRFPYSPTEDLDQVTGLVLAKEVLIYLQEHPEGEVDWDALVREPLIVPQTRPLNSLLLGFQETRTHMALVVDEYGTFLGIVTNEDLLEEIVGEIYDETDQPAEDLWKQSDGSVHVRGTMDLRKLCRHLGLPWEPEEDAVTVGGLMATRLGRLPVVEDELEWRGHRLRVVAAGRRRAERIAVSRVD
jgi:CBS domain containing-hemolysin-like protein